MLTAGVTGTLANSHYKGPSLLDVVKKRGKVVIGVRHTAKPMGYINEKGELVGFTVDLAKEIAGNLGVGLEIRETTSSTRIPLVQTGGIDLAVELSLITKKREEVVDFTVPYYVDRKGNRMVVRKDSPINGYEDLKGKKVAVIQGSYAIKRLKKNAPEAELVVLQDYPATLLAVQRGQADALFAMDYIVNEMLEKVKGDDYRGTPPLEELQLIGMMLREHDSDWRDAINAILQKLWVSGRYTEIYRKHFGQDPHPKFQVQAHAPL